MFTYKLLIIYTDGTEKVVNCVEKHELMDSMFIFTKNGYRHFLPKENVRFFGREFDYKNI